MTHCGLLGAQTVPKRRVVVVEGGAETVLVVLKRFTIVEKVGIAGEMAAETYEAV